MWNWRSVLLLLLLVSAPLVVAQDSGPFPDGETLKYTISYPSGLDLGEVVFEASNLKAADGQPERWQFSFRLNAAIPGYQVDDHVTSIADANLCSLELTKMTSHGERKSGEKTTFNQAAGTAVRETLGGGGTSELKIPDCATDALAFLYYLRRELSKGRVPPARKIFFGAPYDVSFQMAGGQQAKLNKQFVEADQLIVTLKGAVSEAVFILLVARDTNRTPVRITVPLEPGNFTLELAQE
jgi:uncharacterized protein DUF3108